MKTQSLALRNSLDYLYGHLKNLPEATITFKSAPEKWSCKEILGHLIDSAQNNIQRFIRSQYEEQPPKILYQQNEWVRLNHYQQATWQELLQLWLLLNQRLIAIWEAMPEKNHQKQLNMGNSLETLAWMMDDYVAHLQHHGRQILALQAPQKAQSSLVK